MATTDSSLTELAGLLRSGALTSEALVSGLLEATRAAAGLNIYAALDEAGLLAQARAADVRLKAGERLPLLGIPIALKDNIDAAGLPCRVGTAAFGDTPPAADAELVRRLRAAGALIAGKVHMHELAFGITSNNGLTGAVRNPWNPERIPGGSSGGSGAVVAAGLVPASIGTDTGGSVRVPAALCGLAGFRPTVGRIPGEGIAPISATRDTAGPLARSIRDCALLDEVMAADPTPLRDIPLKGLRLGLPDQEFWDDLEPGVRSAVEAACDTLRAAGVELVHVSLPGLRDANNAAGFPIALYEFVRDMGSYLRDKRSGVTLEQVVAGIGSPDVAGVVQPLLAGGAIPEAAYQDALKARARLQAIYSEAFERAGVRALVFPTTRLVAARIGEDQTVSLNGRDWPTFPAFIHNTDPGSNAGIPGVTLPVGLSEGLPVGLGLDGPAGADRELLAIAAAIEDILPAAPRVPAAR
ncbi:MAG: indoleacetamide hydrolase [Comamonadaceae bacterium]|nr:MAG: indoleacetamide hydrolase [Comamonadaceae bacterium]